LQDYGLQVTDYRLSEEIKAKELLHKITWGSFTTLWKATKTKI
jgi:hypothetical protein